jgi:SAM-dependent methyltransferase
MSRTAELWTSVDCVNCGATSSQDDVLTTTRVKHRGSFFGEPLTIVVCRECGLVFQNPQPTTTTLGYFYEREYYAGKTTVTKRQQSETKALLMQPMYAWLCEWLPEFSSWDVADIGSGYGNWLNLFERSNHRIGIESSTQAAACAKEWYEIDTLNVDFMSSDLEPGSFDLVTALAMIEHFLDPLAALVGMNRLLRDDGFVFLYTPDVAGMVLRLGVAKYFKLVHTYYFSQETLESLLGKAGFELVAARRTPPLVDSADVWNRKNHVAGRLELLARKQRSLDLATARGRPHSGNDPAEVFAWYEEALERDRFHEWISTTLRKRGVLAPPIRAALSASSVLRNLVKGKPPSRYEQLCDWYRSQETTAS